jgi:hypothetical protein
MGCGGSKASKASAPAAAPAQTPAQAFEGDFKINLENATGSASLGATVNFPEKKYVLVEAVSEEGLIPAWNKASENTPEMQLKAGDAIVVVNGVFGDSDLMMAELKSNAITLAVKRGPITAEAPAAEAAAPAPEAPAAEAPSAEAPAAEAPAAEAAALAAEASAAAAPAAEAPAVEAPAVEGADEQSTVQPEDGEMGADAKEERCCKLAMC